MHTVVIVEDAPLLRRELVETTPWHQINCKVIGEAEDGLKGKRLIMDLNPDIVIVDVKMPYMSGIEMIEELRAVGNDAQFIIISAYADFNFARDAIRLNVNNYILKPIDDIELFRTLCDVCNTLTNNQVKHKKYPKEFIRNFSNVEQLSNQNCLSNYLEDAIYYMNHNLDQSTCSFEEVAVSVGISESYLRKLFREELDTTFSDLMSMLRMKEAMNLLYSTNLNIYNVAKQVGYEDARYFSSVFKKQLKMTPSQYRRIYKK